MICPSCEIGDLIPHGAGWVACTSCGELLSPENPADWQLFMDAGRLEDARLWWRHVRGVEAQQRERDAAEAAYVAALREEYIAMGADL